MRAVIWLTLFVAALGLEPARLQPVPDKCPDGRPPLTFIGDRFDPGEVLISATESNPFSLAPNTQQTKYRYLRLRVDAVDLGAGPWSLTARDRIGHPLVTMTRADFAGSPDRWTTRIPGSVATIDLSVPPSAKSPTIRFREYIAMAENVERPYYSVKSENNKDFHELYKSALPGDAHYRTWGDSVAFIMASADRQAWGCSGVMVAPRVLMTAWHCGGNNIQDTAYWNEDICRDMLIDFSWDDDPSSRDYGCSGVIDKDKALDFALISIQPIASVGDPRPALLSTTALNTGDPLVMIHHPSMMQKQLTTRCSVTAWSEPGWLPESGNVDLYHDCDTEEGSSGAPVFNASGQLVALHHYGHKRDPHTCGDVDSENKATRIAEIVQFLRRNEKKNGQIAARLLYAA